jgi:hypothetical protein
MPVQLSRSQKKIRTLNNMSTEQFAYWLQGFAETSDAPPTEREWKIIKDHLNTVFHKVTPTPPPTHLDPRKEGAYRDMMRDAMATRHPGSGGVLIC